MGSLGERPNTTTGFVHAPAGGTKTRKPTHHPEQRFFSNGRTRLQCSGKHDLNECDDSAATLAASQTQAECGDASATADCTVQRWQIKPQDAESTLPTYVVYDEATHPSDVVQVWLRCVP